MSGRIVLFGATGYTGGLIAERLVVSGARPVLAGRDVDRLVALADRLGGDVEVAKADVFRQNSVFSLVGGGDVLVSTVGPFVKYGAVPVRAAIAAGATYMDSTGEPTFIRRIFEEFDGPAKDHDARLLTAMGYDWVAGALAGALVLEEAGEGAVRVDVGYYVLGAGSDFGSPGTKESLVGATLDPGHAWRDGRLVSERGASRVRSFAVQGKQRPAMSVGGAEHFTLPAAYPRLRDVNTYLGWFGSLTRAVQAASAASSLAQRVPGTRTVMQTVGERLVALAPSRSADAERGARSVIVGAAYDGRGEQLSEVTLEGVDSYEFTASFLAWAAVRAAGAGLAGTGALSPVLAFGGLDGLREGVEAAGIRPAR